MKSKKNKKIFITVIIILAITFVGSTSYLVYLNVKNFKLLIQREIELTHFILKSDIHYPGVDTIILFHNDEYELVGGYDTYDIFLYSQKNEIEIHNVGFIGWDDRCIVAIQGDMIETKKTNPHLDYSKARYYIIKITDNKIINSEKGEETESVVPDILIGPLSKEEYKKNQCSDIQLFESKKFVARR